VNRPRARVVSGPGVGLYSMQAACEYSGVFGFKTYTSTSEGYRFLVYLYDAESGSLLSVLQADRLGQLRTGAATAVATNHMARNDAAIVGVLGSGYQARTQLEGVCQVREVSNAFVYSPTAGHREGYAREMSERLAIDVTPVESPQQAVEGVDIVVTITNSRVSVIDGHWLQRGVHIAAVGGADQYVTELEGTTFERAGTLVVDDVAQARIECGELILATSEGLVLWEQVRELWQVVGGVVPGRSRRDEITLFKSLGIALWDVAAAKAVYDKALSWGIGTRL
jgi:alanine dehydrogenase